MELRDYQTALINLTKSKLLGGNRAVLIQLGCGGGKSVIAGEITRSATDKHNDVLFIVHRRELCEQIRHTFKHCGVNFEHCDVKMVQTLARRMKTFQSPKVLIIDECHHAMANQYQKVIEACPDSIILGFTATPNRLDGKDLTKVFPVKVEGPSTRWLIDHGFLADFDFFAAPLLVGDYGIARGEYKDKDIDAEIDSKPQLYGDAVKQWVRLANDRKTIVYCHSIHSAESLCQEYLANGIKAAVLTGNTATFVRMETVDSFRKGKTMVLINVDLFGEGFDVPDCECVQLLRPTASQTVYVQQSMRSMRFKEGKRAIILDHTQNYKKFGLPDALIPPRIKTKGKEKQKNSQWPKIIDCEQCFHVNIRENLKEYTEKRTCDFCGMPLVMEKEVVEMETVECDLVRVNGIPDVSKLLEKDDIKDWDTLRAYQKQQGYKFGWCFHQARARGIPIPSKYNAYMYMRGIH